jgi:hypothetical protein
MKVLTVARSLSSVPGPDYFFLAVQGNLAMVAC